MHLIKLSNLHQITSGQKLPKKLHKIQVGGGGIKGVQNYQGSALDPGTFYTLMPMPTPTQIYTVFTDIIYDFLSNTWFDT